MDISSYLDSTILALDAKYENVDALAQQAVNLQVASLCIDPYFVKRISEQFPSLNICTVIGFPHGIQCTSAKCEEIRIAQMEGASEFDVVINIHAVQNKDWEYISNEIKILREVIKEDIFKLIIESSLWNEQELIELVNFLSDKPIDFIKTSTGFNGQGATMEAIKVIMQHKGEKQAVKASGGIATARQAWDYINLGVSRIGTSKANIIIEENKYL